MNNALAWIIGKVNAILAFFIVAISFLLFGLSQQIATGSGEFDSGLALVGLLIGSIVAVIICGTLALFVSMRNSLRKIEKLLEK